MKQLATVQAASDKTLNMLKKITTAEIAVLEHIVARQQEDVVKNRVMMKQMAAILRVPRLHHQFIASAGVFDFIKDCERIVQENDYSRKRSEAKQARAEQRRAIDMSRLNR